MTKTRLQQLQVVMDFIDLSRELSNNSCLPVAVVAYSATNLGEELLLRMAEMSDRLLIESQVKQDTLACR